MKKLDRYSCCDCSVYNCCDNESKYPEFCLTEKLTEKDYNEIYQLYAEEENNKITVTAAEIESDFYLKYTRVQEIIEFAHRMEYKKIGIATCSGLIKESKVFANILRKNGFEVICAICKVGSMKKTDVGIPLEKTEKTGEVMCNPILQAKIMNKAKTDLNVVVGLCVGHDSLFYKYAEGITTTLITKDRVTGHNPAVPLYQAESYYKRLIEKSDISENS